MTAALEVSDLRRSFGALRAVDDVSFEVDAGQICAFIGPNGAGKTTTMRVCATLDLPDAGEVLVEGCSVLDQPREVRARLGFMPDGYGSYPNTPVRDYLDFFARAYGLRGEARRRTLGELVEFTALGPLLDKPMAALSKGMRQRLCLAKTLLNDPRVLILDEPAAGLDPRARIELRELVKALAGTGKAVLISSHILSELAEISTHVVVIERGRVRAAGAVEEMASLARKVKRVFVRCLADAQEVERFCLEQPHVLAARRDGRGVQVEHDADEEELAGLLEALQRRGLQPVELRHEGAGLEDLFLQLTEGQVQ